MATPQRPPPRPRPRYLPMWFPPRPPPGYLPMWGAPGPSGLGALHWLHSLRHEKFMFSQALRGEKTIKIYIYKKKKKGLMRSSPPPHTLYLKFFGGEIKNSRVWALPVAGALLAAPAAGEAAPVAAAGAAVAAAEAAASHGACGEFWGEKRGILGLPQRSRTQLATHLPGRGRPGRLRRRG